MGQLMVALAVSDTFNAVVGLLGQTPTNYHPQSGLCQVQGMDQVIVAVLMEIANLSSCFLDFCLALNAFYIVVIEGSTSYLRSYQRYTICASFTMPLLIAMIPIVLNDMNYYGHTDLWCWIASSKNRLLHFYIPLWIITLLNIASYGAVWWRLRQTEKSIVRKSTRSNSEATLLRLILAYTLTVCIAWVPGTINRLNDYTLLTSRFPWTFIQALVAPARGLLNALAFMYVFWDPIQKSRRLARSKTPFSMDDPEGNASIVIQVLDIEPPKMSKGEENSSLEVLLSNTRKSARKKEDKAALSSLRNWLNALEDKGIDSKPPFDVGINSIHRLQIENPKTYSAELKNTANTLQSASNNSLEYLPPSLSPRHSATSRQGTPISHLESLDYIDPSYSSKEFPSLGASLNSGNDYSVPNRHRTYHSNP
jgi:hypothetical protein